MIEILETIIFYPQHCYKCLYTWHSRKRNVKCPNCGSEVYGALINNRKAIGIELKESYYQQAVKNIETAKKQVNEGNLFEVI